MGLLNLGAGGSGHGALLAQCISLDRVGWQIYHLDIAS
jgi:hypothetical protein